MPSRHTSISIQREKWLINDSPTYKDRQFRGKPYVGWGYFDPGEGAGGTAAFGDYKEGYQLVPTNWGINTDRKKSYFEFLRKVTSS